MGLHRAFIDIDSNEPIPNTKGVDIYYIPFHNGGNSGEDNGEEGRDKEVVRVIELNSGFPDIARLPDEYRGIIDKVFIVAAFDNEYSVQDISYYRECYLYLGVPIHVIINKKDLRTSLNTCLISNDEFNIHIVSCKYDDNYLNLGMC